MPFTPLFAKTILDWTTGAAAASQPGGRFLSLATASPRSDSSFDGPYSAGIGGFGRATVTFAAANSPAMSATNLNAFSNLTATAAGATVIGFNLWDASSGGNRLLWGTVTANIGVKSADNVGIAAGAIKITLS